MDKDPFSEAFGTHTRTHGRDDLPVIPACVKPRKQQFLCEICREDVHLYLAYYVKRYYGSNKITIEAILKEEIKNSLFPKGKFVDRYLCCGKCLDSVREIFSKTKEPYEDIVYFHIDELVKWSNKRIGRFFSLYKKERNSLNKNDEYRKKIWNWIIKTRAIYGMVNGKG
jgi:hypothetical protein